MPPRDLDAIKRIAIHEGVARGASSVRVADAHIDSLARARMIASFDRGDLATWGYDATYAQRATEPSDVLPGARSVLCVALPYARPRPHERRGRGRVSNYAWSADYHARMRTLLHGVACAIEAAAGERCTAIVCDTAPLAERAYAAHAGVGWIGKHTNLIAKDAGSFVFLGEIVTTLALPPDAPLRTSCGACTRCVGACPTGALRGDYTIDATRCISDLTQRTGEIPRALRPLVGTWVWGCDLCQTACPPTQRAGEDASLENEPLDGDIAAPDLLTLLRLRSGEFKRRYGRTAMGWRGAAVLRRNAAVALGNELDRAHVPSLIEALERDPHPMVRAHAAWALGRIASPPALLALRTRAARELDGGAVAEIRAALEPFDRGEALAEA